MSRRRSVFSRIGRKTLPTRTGDVSTGDSLSGIFGVNEIAVLKELDSWSLAESISTGFDGTKTSTTTEILNVETYLSASASASDTTISVNDATGISENDRILIVQQEGTSSTTGNWEYIGVAGVSGTTITLKQGLANSYTLGTATVVRVPQYTTFNLNTGSSIQCTAYNGTYGGIIAIAANTINFNGGAITATGKGFRGAYHNDPSQIGNFPHGGRGEGYTGSYNAGTSGQEGGAGGGGQSGVAGGANGGGGGGAGHRGNGSAGGSNGANGAGGAGGLAYGQTDLLTRATMGAGGSSGGRHDVSGVQDAGEGGGVIFLFADNYTRSATTSIYSQGSNASRTGSYKGGTSGGAGGSIIIVCGGTVTGSATVNIYINQGGNASGSNNGAGSGTSSQGRFAYYGPSFTFTSSQTMDVNTTSFDDSKIKIGI